MHIPRTFIANCCDYKLEILRRFRQVANSVNKRLYVNIFATPRNDIIPFRRDDM